VNALTEAAIAHTVAGRLDEAANLLLRAVAILESYVEIGCPPPRHVERLTQTEESASALPSLFERARQNIARSCIDIETAMLVLMSVPGNSTAEAVRLAKSIRGLPDDKREKIRLLVKACKLLSDVNAEVAMCDGCQSRVDLRSASNVVIEKAKQASRLVDEAAA